MVAGRASMRGPSNNGVEATTSPRKAHWTGRCGDDGAIWNLYCGDAGSVLASLPANRYGCVVTSPPYFWQRDYEVDGQLGVESSIDEYVSAIAGVMGGVRRVLHPRGVLFLNLGDTYYS